MSGKEGQDNQNGDKGKKPITIDGIKARIIQQKLQAKEKELEPAVKDMLAAEATYDAAREKAETIAGEIKELAEEYTAANKAAK